MAEKNLRAAAPAVKNDRPGRASSSRQETLALVLGLSCALFGSSADALTSAKATATQTKSEAASTKTSSDTGSYKTVSLQQHSGPFNDGTPRKAASGVTAVSGQVVTLDGAPIPNVSVSDGSQKVLSDQNGRYLIAGLKAGPSVLIIDATHASDGKQDYGYYEVQIVATRGETLALPYKNWLPKIDHAHDVTFPSPTISEVVISNPALPGLELRLPAGAVITGADHKPVTKIGITPIPVDRTPFPLPQNVKVPIYFTVQPAGAIITGVDGKWVGAHVWYPNFDHQLPNARVGFFKYDPYQLGWTIYGTGRVSPDQKQYIPDDGTRIYNLTSAMINVPGFTPPPNPPPAPPPCAVHRACAAGGPGRPRHPPPGSPGHHPDGPPGGNPPKTPPKPPCCGASGGDPVDLASGLWTDSNSDFELKGISPLVVSRTYMSSDVNVRSFGVGMTMNYETYLWSANQYQEVDLIMPNGSRVHYVRTSPGTGYADAVFTASVNPGAYYNSQITWGGAGWNLTLPDGTLYYFPEYSPLAYIQDRYGNRVSITRNGGSQSPIDSVSSSSGRYVKFTYTNGVITQATDDSGRTVQYGYDSAKRLQTVTDPNGGITTYSWDNTNNRITGVQRPRQYPSGPNEVTNQYDGNGRVHLQTTADGTVWKFDYTLDGSGHVTETDVTDGNLNVSQTTFNTAGYWLTQKWAVGTAVEQDFAAVLGGSAPPSACTGNTPANSPTNRLIAETDPLGRLSCWTYDASGQLLTVTRLAGTAGAVTTSFEYGPFEQLTKITDPLSHTVQIARDNLGRPTSTTDGVGNVWPIVTNADGTTASVSDPLGNQTSYFYERGDLIKTSNPLNNPYAVFTDTIGRAIRQADPLGNVWQWNFDPIWGLHTATDPNGNTATKSYNADGSTSIFVDPRSTVGTPIQTQFFYDNLDRLTKRTDALLQDATINLYDGNGNVKSATDRKGQATSYNYDALNRLTKATYADGHVLSFTWDNGNRLKKIQDVVGGVANVITRTFDNLDRLKEEVVTQGVTSVSDVKYNYDDANRRSNMTVVGQPLIQYTWDNANRLKKITQGTAIVTIGYDTASRRHQVTMPNGIVATYTYDAASELKQLSYDLGSTNVGTLTYDYALDGHVTHRGGSLFSSVLPNAVSSATYDVNNRMTHWNGTILGYDSNGNLLSDGTNSYNWDARNRLTSVGSLPTFVYDGAGRRESVSNAGGTVTSSYDNINPVQENAAGTLTNLLTGLSSDERFTRAGTSGVSTVLVDAEGSTAALTNSSGTIQTSYAYDPYGVTTTSGATTDNPYQFTGRLNDGTGLYYNRARYYNPAWGRFISEDPLGLQAGSNLYAYTANPVYLTDPLGLWTLNVGFTVGGSGTWLGSWSFSAGVLIDGNGDAGTYETLAGGPGTAAGWSGSGGVGAGFSPDAQNICDQAGPFHMMAGAVGDGLAGSGDVYWGDSPDGPVHGINGYVGVGGGGSVSAGGSYTWVQPILWW